LAWFSDLCDRSAFRSAPRGHAGRQTDRSSCAGDVSFVPAILIALLTAASRAPLSRPRARQVASSADHRDLARQLGAIRGTCAVDAGRENKDVRAARGHRHHPIAIFSSMCCECARAVVLATINIATATHQATLSFLGVGVPPTEPSSAQHDPRRQRLRFRECGDGFPRAGSASWCVGQTRATGCAMR